MLKIISIVGYLALALSVSRSFAAEAYWPVHTGRLTSTVGWRKDPFGSGKLKYHRGYDIAVPHGTTVMATAPGKVYFSGQYKGYGLLIVVEHSSGIYTMYGHNSKLLVRVGEIVQTGTPIALAGSTGRSTGSHVHYEIRHVAGSQKPQKNITLRHRQQFVGGFGGFSGEGQGGE